MKTPTELTQEIKKGCGDLFPYPNSMQLMKCPYVKRYDLKEIDYCEKCKSKAQGYANAFQSELEFLQKIEKKCERTQDLLSFKSEKEDKIWEGLDLIAIWTFDRIRTLQQCLSDLKQIGITPEVKE